eukprot:scaffold211087_cov66-Cyclotella_meneghiniana.AAC.2
MYSAYSPPDRAQIGYGGMNAQKRRKPEIPAMHLINPVSIIYQPPLYCTTPGPLERSGGVHTVRIAKKMASRRQREAAVAQLLGRFGQNPARRLPPI